MNKEVDYVYQCIHNDIKVYPVVHDMDHFAVEVDYAGRKKRGVEIFNWRTEQKKLNKKILEIYNILGKNITNRQ